MSTRNDAATAILTLALALVCPWSALAAPDDTTADAVFGQPDFNDNFANEGGNPSDRSLNGNRGLTVDPTTGRLWVCDTSNNRVLSWEASTEYTNHDQADIVLGQVNFTDNADNEGQANPSASSLSGPRDIAVDLDGRVYVADSGNKRILRYDPPIDTHQAAVQVFGQAGDFTTANQAAGNAATADNLGNPDGIAVDSLGNVYLADLFLHRVLVFTTPATTDTTADLVIGQPNLTSAERNQNDGNPVPAANTLNNPEGVAIDAANNLYVVDQSNNRVLRFTAPLSTNQAATRVYGQPDFVTGSAGTSATTMDVPVAADIDPISGNLYVADSINDRILEFTNPANDSTADRVFGQPDFTTDTSNTGGVSATTLFDVGGVTVDISGNLIAGDRLNHRVLVYDIGPDFDGDSVGDGSDNCPFVSNPDQANSDGDFPGDVCEECPNDASKQLEGDCGCGVADTDTDSDGTADCNDDCPDDAAKTAEGSCGCGTADTDTDSDGSPDCIDGCPNDATSAGPCGCGVAETDTDDDGTPDCVDNCPNASNDQTDSDGDGVGDVCEPTPDDTDGDAVLNDEDNCPDDSNPNQEDGDNDGIGDACEQDCAPCGPGAAAATAVSLMLMQLSRRRRRARMR